MAVPLSKLRSVAGVLSFSLVCPALARQNTEIVSPIMLDAAGQRNLLETMRDYAEQYVSNLPNFTCFQITHQFEAGRRPNHWHKGDTLTSKLVFSQGHEDRTLQLVNDKPVMPGMKSWRTPLTTEGEFGVLLGSVFGSFSDTSFAWRGWEVLRDKRLAVFDYSIDAAHSTLKLSLSDLAQAVVPYHGTVYADAATGGIWRITQNASHIPPEVRTRNISTTIDYGEVPIRAVVHLLPVKASVFLTTDTDVIRHEIEFTNYQKFETDSKITYANDGNPAYVPAENQAHSTAPPKP